jgi:curli production assembly/transport component CsgE
VNRWQRRWAALLAVAAFLPEAPTLAAEGPLNGERRQPGFLQEIYAGVITNQTVSFVGQRFYREFVTQWSDKPGTDRYSLGIHERPSARWGSLIWIEYSNRKVFQTFVFPGRADIKAVGEQAVETAYQNVVEADVQRLLIKEPDVGPDEI